MKESIKNKIITFGFIIIIIGIFFINIIIKDKNISVTERRKLAKLPEINIKTITNNKFSKDFEKYAMDQMILRDEFRNIKSIFNFKILNKKDNNGYFMEDGIIYKQIEKLNENEIIKAANKIKYIQNKYFKNNKIYYSIIPDKTYFCKNNELKVDYNKLENIMKNNIDNIDNKNKIKYINIFNYLNIDDYYKADTHWKQENIIKIAKKLTEEMGKPYELNNIQIKEKGNFKGVYYGQIGLKIKEEDKLNYITNENIENARTFNIETKKLNTIYDEEKWINSYDKYDYYLSGATPIIEISNDIEMLNVESKTNKTNKTNNTNKINKENEKPKELIIFRDSFGSSIAPLFIESYDKITLIDLRYVSTDYLDKLIDFNENQDILFLYSTLILNESSILK